MTGLMLSARGRLCDRLAALTLTVLLVAGPAFAQVSPDKAGGADVPSSPSLILRGVIVAIPAGTPWLSLGQGFLCVNPVTQTWNGGRAQQDLQPYAQAFKEELGRAGYKVVIPEDNLFQPDATGSADYEVAAVITDAHIHGCRGGILSGNGPDDVKGDGTMIVQWQVYSPIKKELVVRMGTSRAITLDKGEPGGLQRLITDVFAANVRGLIASPDFRTAMAAPTPLSNGFVLPGQQSKIALAGNLKGGKRSISDAVGSVVTILVSNGSGSGVLVSDDGYLLTNAHVVGDEKEARVRWSDGIETLAQVVRVAKDRDVAILKTSSRDRTPLAIKRGVVTPGQKVYAIGSPKGPNFQGTVSSGVVSASNRIMNGLRYIQSDTSVSPGSSGGALLDETGSLIGLTDLGVPNEGQPAGLNLFIPIGDAVDFLSLDPQ